MIRSCAAIENHYLSGSQDHPDLKSMLSLVSCVASSRYSGGLFPWTSMRDLCLAQTHVSYPYDGPYLRISPLFDGTIHFSFVDTPKIAKQWQRVEAKNDAFVRLEKFFDQLHWFG